MVPQRKNTENAEFGHHKLLLNHWIIRATQDTLHNKSFLRGIKAAETH